MAKNDGQLAENDSTISKTNKSKSTQAEKNKVRTISLTRKNEHLPPPPAKYRNRSVVVRKSETPPPIAKKKSRRSDHEPSVKKPRDSEPAEEEMKRSRRSTKYDCQASRHCCICRDETVDEELKQCESCDGRYHLSKCLRYHASTAKNHFENDEWRCPRCITCATCHKLVDDPANVECSRCHIAYHGTCHPKGTYLTEKFNSDWVCHSCNQEPKKKKRETYVLVPHTVSSPPDMLPRPRKSRNMIFKESAQLQFNDETIEELTEVINIRDYIFEKLSYEKGLRKEKPTLPDCLQKKSKKNKKRKSSARSDDEANMIAMPYDKDLFDKSLAEAYSLQPSSSEPPSEQWIHFGTGEDCKAIYKSAFEEPLFSAPHLFACKFCLHTTNIKEDFVAHWKYCNARFPPGNEIYRHENIAFFEVDGANQKKYCQDLCLISKLFIESKTLYDEVETFIFYVLCEIQREGYVIVGYFSKEKNPSKNNNLSCLLVLPLAQKMGYGSLLIDMSYELSRIEHKVGHPEHPLSDLGILAYRAYWRSSILCYLRNNRHLERMSLKDMSLATRITATDLVNQMLLDNLIVLKNGIYSIKIGKRALKYPLSRIRRRAVERSKIVWKPVDDGKVLDPNKINTYV